MSKLLKTFILILIALLIPSYPTILAQDIPKPDFSCLTRTEKEEIAVCFRQDKQCHSDLEYARQEPTLESEWTYFIGTFILGGIGGVILAQQLHK